jgi:hypothetical protein
MKILSKDDIILFISGISMKSKKIKKFGMDGVIADDSMLPGKKDNYRRIVEDAMRTSGYIPVLDIDPQFILIYDESKDVYLFDFFWYGIYVGKKKAQEIEGFSGQRYLPRKN